MSLLILIDGGYLKRIAPVPADLARFPQWVVGVIQGSTSCQSIDLLRTIYYDCPPYQSSPPTPDERTRAQRFDKFRSFLEHLPRFEVRLGRLVRRLNERGEISFEQKRVDVLLVVDLLYYSLSGRVSDVALVAGDADFIPAVQRVKDAGVRVWLFHGRRSSVAAELYRLVDERIPLLDESGQKPLFPIRG